MESNLAAKEAIRTIHQKRHQKYTDEDYTRLESLMYDKLSLRLQDAQVSRYYHALKVLTIGPISSSSLEITYNPAEKPFHQKHATTCISSRGSTSTSRLRNLLSQRRLIWPSSKYRVLFPPYRSTSQTRNTSPSCASSTFAYRTLETTAPLLDPVSRARGQNQADSNSRHFSVKQSTTTQLTRKTRTKQMMPTQPIRKTNFLRQKMDHQM